MDDLPEAGYIRNMEAGRELDKIVAKKVLGRKPCTAWHPLDPYRWISTCHHNGTCYPVGNPPNYSTNIAAAWEVVEKLQSMEINIELLAYDNGEYACYLGKELPNMGGSQEIAENSSGSSMPLAICRAALLAVSGDT